MMPSCDQTGVPIHFHSSTTSGSASLMSLRILPRVFPRQSPSSAILFEMSSDAERPWLAPDFFMFASLPTCASTGSPFGAIGFQGLNELGDRAQATAFNSRNLSEALLEPQARHRPLQNVGNGDQRGVPRL